MINDYDYLELILVLETRNWIFKRGVFEFLILYYVNKINKILFNYNVWIDKYYTYMLITFLKEFTY